MSARSRAKNRRRGRARTGPQRPGAPARPRTAGSWWSRHRVRAFHVLWLAVSAAFVVEAGLLVDHLDDRYTTLVAFGGTAAVWGVLGMVIGLLASPLMTKAERRRLLRPGRPRGRSGPPGPMPWRWPWVAAYAVVVPALVLVAGLLGSDDDDDAYAQAVVWAFCALLGWLIGVLVALLAAVVWLAWAGAVAFGRVAVTGRIDGERVPRAPYIGAFIALVGLSALPVVLLGAGSYDSPYRRDVLPLVGIFRDGVEVTHPRLLLAAQLGTWWLLAGMITGVVVHNVVAARARRGAETGPTP